MYLVERTYSRGRHPRRRPKAVGYHMSRITGSASDWNKETFGYSWVRIMIWNKAASQYEGGIPLHNTVNASYKRGIR